MISYLNLYNYIELLKKERSFQKENLKDEFYVDRKLNILDRIRIYDKIILDLETLMTNKTKEQVHD